MSPNFGAFHLLAKQGRDGGEGRHVHKAYSKRDSHDNRRRASDTDALIGRDGRTYGLGYKAHITASANDNEKKHAPGLLDKAVAALRLGVPGKARSIATFGW
jgi:hypothetical protein